ncbi:hypothetical protein Tco_0485430 [Tanacetum coccineum]
MKGSTSSYTHGWDKSSSSLCDFFFFDLDFQCPPSLSSLSERASVYFEREFRLHLSERADTLFPLLPSLLNTPPSFDLCLGDLDHLRLILENTLVFGLRKRLDLCLFSCSLVSIVFYSEYRDVPKHPSKLSQDFSSFSFSLFSFSRLNFSAMIGSN